MYAPVKGLENKTLLAQARDRSGTQKPHNGTRRGTAPPLHATQQWFPSWCSWGFDNVFVSFAPTLISHATRESFKVEPPE